MAAASDWTEDRVKLLLELRAKGLSASQIGRYMSVSKNAVIGKAARLVGRFGTDYDRQRARPKRIRRVQPPKPPKPKKPPRRFTNFERTPDELKSPGTLPVTPAPADMPAARARGPAALAALQPGDCRWPIGDPRDPGFRFCGAACERGEFYCSHHRVRSTHRDYR